MKTRPVVKLGARGVKVTLKYLLIRIFSCWCCRQNTLLEGTVPLMNG